MLERMVWCNGVTCRTAALTPNSSSSCSLPPREISAVAADVVGNTRGYGSGRSRSLSGGSSDCSSLQKWSHLACSSSSSSSSRAELAHAVVMMLPMLLFTEMELEVFVLCFRTLASLSLVVLIKGEKGCQWATFIPE